MTTDAVRTARVPARLAGLPTLRPTLERWLAGCDPARHGLGPHAIVLLRRFDAPWARVTGADDSARDALFGHALAGAPHGGRAGASADAVWFANECDLLAWLARDALAGTLSQRWWWRLWLRARVDASGAMTAWLDGARAVPGAVRQLGADPAAAWWFSTLEREAAQPLVEALARHYDIHVKVQAWALCGDAGAEAQLIGTLGGHATSSPTAANVLHARARRLAGLCLALAADAGAARDAVAWPWASSTLARAAQASGQASPVISLASPTAAPATRRQRTPATRYAGRPHAREQSAMPVQPATTVRPAGAAQEPPAEQLPPIPQGIHKPVTPPFVAPGQAIKGRAIPARLRDRHRLALPRAPDDEPRFNGRRGSPSHGPVVAAVFDTHLGGLIFLLNAALQLGLYGDFTQPRLRELPVSPWHFLRLAGRRWCGPVLRTDPLDAWLASKVSPRRAATPNRDWSLPAAWLLPFAGETRPWHAVWQDGRLRLWHPQGFEVVDRLVPASRCKDVLTETWEHLRWQPRCCLKVSNTRPFPRQARMPQLPSALWRYLHARLALAVGLPRKHALGWMVMPARCAAGGHRLDVHFSLQALPLRVRLAGLDRDPGWIPAAGCDLRFHFR